MNSSKNALPGERSITPRLAAVTGACALTSLMTYTADSHSSWLQWAVLGHVLCAIAFTGLVGWYLVLHFRRTLGLRRFSVLFSGILSALPVLALVGTGWAMLVDGQREALRWVYSWHTYAAVLLLAFVPLHLILHYVRRARLRAGADVDFPSVPAETGRYTFGFGVAVLLLILVAGFAYDMALPAYGNTAAAPAYDYTKYGEHPFRPSQTETATHTFVDKRQVANSRRCISCHRDVAEQWYSSVHRQAASDVAYVTNVNLLEKKRGIVATRYCEGCHAPVALLSGELSPGGKHGGVPDTVANEEGVTCMACHGIESLVHLKGVASYKWRGREDYLFGRTENSLLLRIQDLLIRARPDQHKADLGKPLFRDPKLCSACHTQFMDKDFNNWGWVKMQDDYGAWVKSPYSKQHEESFSSSTAARCQDCHMPLVKADDPSGDANGMVRSHRFLGANTFLPIIANDHEHLALTKAFLTSDKLRVSIEHPERGDALQTLQPLAENLRKFDEAPYYYYLGETAKLRVAVTNRGVGHAFPGGTIDINEAWVELLVFDSEGSEVFSSGAIGAGNDVDPNAVFYRSLPVDRKGQLVWKHDLFNMIGESFRRVIPAGESDIAEYTFPVPAWAKSPLTVTASLKYRKLNDRYAEFALRDKYFEIPAINLAWSSLDIPLRMRHEVN
jgi:hypothetical protein